MSKHGGKMNAEFHAQVYVPGSQSVEIVRVTDWEAEVAETHVRDDGVLISTYKPETARFRVEPTSPLQVMRAGWVQWTDMAKGPYKE